MIVEIFHNFSNIFSTSKSFEIRPCAKERVKKVQELWPIKNFIINHLVALIPIFVKFPKLSKFKFGAIKDFPACTWVMTRCRILCGKFEHVYSAVHELIVFLAFYSNTGCVRKYFT